MLVNVCMYLRDVNLKEIFSSIKMNGLINCLNVRALQTHDDNTSIYIVHSQ